MGNSQMSGPELLKELVFQILYAWVLSMHLAFKVGNLTTN
jgi:hypothetical protein